MFAQRLREMRKKARLTQVELGEAVGYTKTTVSTWERDVCKPPVDIVEDLAHILGTTASYLLGYTDDPEDYDNAQELSSVPAEWFNIYNGDTEAMVKAYRAMDKDRARELSLPPGALPIMRQRIPLLGSIHAGEPTFSDVSFDCYVEVGAAIRCDFALRVVGDSMVNARILDGDIVFIRKQDTVENGEIAAVLLDDETTLKRVRFLPGGMTLFAPENPAYQPIVVGGEGETREVRILGKAVAFQSNIH